MKVLNMSNVTETNGQTVIIPFGLKYNPMKKLALINFERDSDSVYIGLEPQFFDDDTYGKGYRIIAYRCDGYVDVYDDINLNHIEDENFDIAGKGLCERKRVVIENTMFQVENGCLQISFKFIDKNGRDIIVRIIEQTTKKTKKLNLLAPIGYSTENPSYLPLFFLYDFDFVRKHKTDVEIIIDGKKLKLDNFPVPILKDFQKIYYTRYTTDCQMIEFANAKNCVLDEHKLNSSGLLIHKSFEYQYSKCTLQRITLKHSSHPLSVIFNRGFPDIRGLKDGTEYVDTFKITTDGTVGSISGKYFVKRSGNFVKTELSPSDGWTPVANSLLTRMLFGKKSIFCSWPKTYRYTQNININTLESTSYWERVK